MEKLAADLRLACSRIARRIRFEGEHELAPHHVSAMTRIVTGAAMPSEIAELERVSAPSMTRTLNCLAERGMVRRAPHPDDKRSVLVELTPAGRDALRREAEAQESWVCRRLAGLTGEERDALAKAVEVLAKVATT